MTVDKLIAMREIEGQAMARDVDHRIDHLKALLVKLEALAATWPALALERLRSRLHALLDDTKIEIDPNRVATEAAILADRADTTEEMTRLASHLSQMATLSKSTGPVGTPMFTSRKRTLPMPTSFIACRSATISSRF